MFKDYLSVWWYCYGRVGKSTGQGKEPGFFSPLMLLIFLCKSLSLSKLNSGTKGDDLCHYLGLSSSDSLWCQKRTKLTKYDSLVEFRILEAIFGFLKTSILCIKERKRKYGEVRRVTKSTGVHRCLGITRIVTRIRRLCRRPTWRQQPWSYCSVPTATGQVPGWFFNL